MQDSGGKRFNNYIRRTSEVYVEKYYGYGNMNPSILWVTSEL